MEIRRFTTAETPAGVVTQTDNVLDTASRESTDVINIWGFDAVPNLPVGPEHVLGAFQQLGAFGPLGGIRADLYIMPPFGDEPPDLAELASKIDLGTGGGMVPGAEGGGMHRTDTIDFVTVIEGETNVAYPGEDGSEHEITIKAGDFLTHNGTFHRWHNRSGKTCTLLLVTIASERKDS
jgi:Cupin domain